VGDVVGRAPPWADAGNPLGYTGDRYCGTLENWTDAGLPGYTGPTVTTDATGFAPCCLNARMAGAGGVGIGGTGFETVPYPGHLVGSGSLVATYIWESAYPGHLVGGGTLVGAFSWAARYPGVLAGSGGMSSASSWSASYPGHLAGSGSMASVAVLSYTEPGGASVVETYTTGQSPTWTASYEGHLDGSGTLSAVVVEPMGLFAWGTGWYDGSGTFVLQGQNIASFTRTAAGTYVFAFTTAAPDTLYTVLCSVGLSQGDTTSLVAITPDGTQLAGSFEVRFAAPVTGILTDPQYVQVAVFHA
jgi:hypothetical protein